MPTIEVEDSDVVFVVKGRGAQRGGYHVLGPRDLLVMVQMVPADEQLHYTVGLEREVPSRIFVGENLDALHELTDPQGSILIPYSRIYVGGSRVSGLERFRFEIDSGNDPRVEVLYQGPRDNYRHTDELLSRLEPFVTVLRPSVGGVDLVQAPDRYIGVRVSRYDRKPVI